VKGHGLLTILCCVLLLQLQPLLPEGLFQFSVLLLDSLQPVSTPRTGQEAAAAPRQLDSTGSRLLTVQLSQC
jgi:hypothetical protein